MWQHSCINSQAAIASSQWKESAPLYMRGINRCFVIPWWAINQALEVTILVTITHLKERQDRHTKDHEWRQLHCQSTPSNEICMLQYGGSRDASYNWCSRQEFREIHPAGKHGRQETCYFRSRKAKKSLLLEQQVLTHLHHRTWVSWNPQRTAMA